MLYALLSFEEIVHFHGSCTGNSFYHQGGISWPVTKQGRDKHPIVSRTNGGKASFAVKFCFLISTVSIWSEFHTLVLQRFNPEVKPEVLWMLIQSCQYLKITLNYLSTCLGRVGISVIKWNGPKLEILNFSEKCKFWVSRNPFLRIFVLFSKYIFTKKKHCLRSELSWTEF